MYYLPIVGTAVSNLIELGNISPYILTLADNIGENHYTRFYQQHKLIIVDNMIYEKEKAVDIDVLIEKAKLVNATEIIAPDVLYDGEATVNTTTRFIDCLSKQELSRFDIQAVIQGKNLADVLNCTLRLYKIPEITTLGFSCLAIPHVMCSITNTDDVMTNRVMFINWLAASGVLNGIAFEDLKQYHLLGLGNNVAELTYMKRMFRSCDSSLPFVMAQYGVPLVEGLGDYSIKERHHNMENSLNESQLQLAKQNIELCIKLAEVNYEVGKNIDSGTRIP
jgi:hypothetical protein